MLYASGTSREQGMPAIEAASYPLGSEVDKHVMVLEVPFAHF